MAPEYLCDMVESYAPDRVLRSASQNPVACLGFHFGVGGGGFKIFLEKWGHLHGARGGGFGGMLPQENFKKWCNLLRFREYFAKILSKKNNLKNSHFLYKNNRSCITKHYL